MLFPTGPVLPSPAFSLAVDLCSIRAPLAGRCRRRPTAPPHLTCSHPESDTAPVCFARDTDQSSAREPWRVYAARMERRQLEYFLAVVEHGEEVLQLSALHPGSVDSPRFTGARLVCIARETYWSGVALRVAAS